ncbi:MAG: T9SS type A sorting domain-containing protein, partial [Bacteroidales bacterium]|nr:T9SS type A sorting domain-containing protein [Bacteroidales bacterium]
VSESRDEIYGSTDYAISIYNKKYNEVRKLSKVNGLSDGSISTIAYSQDNDALLIAYSSGNIDIYDRGLIKNIPDIMNYFISGNISLNRMRAYGGYAYLTGRHGIFIININKREIKDTWRPSADGADNEVFDLIILNDTIFAATATGLFRASVNNQGLAYHGNWDIVQGTNGNTCNCLSAVDGILFINKRNMSLEYDSVFSYSDGSLNYLPGLPQTRNLSFEAGNSRLIISAGRKLIITDTEGELIRLIDEYGDQQIDARHAVLSGDDIIIADRNQGLVRITGDNHFENYIPQGPYTGNSFDITASGGNVWVAAGGVTESWDNTWSPFMFFSFINRRWSSVTRSDAWDAMKVVPVPGVPGNIFVSSWGSGLYEYAGDQTVNHWAESTLGSIIPGQPYVRIGGMAVDSDRNLWITQSGVQNNIKVLMNDKSWLSLPYNIDAPTTANIMITQSKLKWVVLPGSQSLFVLDDNSSPGYFDDDRHKELIIKDQSGKVLSGIYCIAEDLDGNIWIGTGEGPAVYYNPDRVFDQDIYASRIKVPRNDGSGLADYLLGTETILSIALDGGNRKWLGTKNSGAYLIAESGNELVKNYNTANSPLLSDKIMSLAVDGSTGEVWFGTARGIMTVRETGTEGSEQMNRVYAYPNPVREDFTGDITITGLSRNTNVKITDISGNLVYETRSTGGDASWDMKTYKGEKVSTGVYLVLCNNADGTVTSVTKILIIR